MSIFDPEKLRARWADDAAYCHKLVEFADYLSKSSEESLVRVLERSLNGEIKDVAFLDKWRSIIVATDNFDKLHLKKNLQAKLEGQGYEVVEIECEKTPGKSEEYKELREQAEADKGAEFAALEVPDTMSPDDARTVLSTHGHSRLETLQARKCLYQFEFPNCDFDNAEFCTTWLIKSKGKKLSQLRAEWAARNPEQAKSIDRWHLRSKLKQAHNLHTGVSMADVSQMSPQADIFAKAKLPEAIDIIATELYGNEHPEVVRVASWANKNQGLLKRVLRMKFDDDCSNVDIFNSMARKLGYQPQVEKNAGKDGCRQKQYILSDFCNPDRGHMLKSLSDKFAAKLEQKGENLGGEPVSEKPDWGVDAAALEKRRAAAKPEPIVKAQPVATIEPWLTEGKGWEFQMFEADLIDAASLEELNRAKSRTPEETRRAVMSVWADDGRFDWLREKSARLEADLLVGVAI